MSRFHFRMLKRQIVAIFILILAFMLIGITLADRIFFAKYYISKKVEVLEEAKNYLEELDTDIFSGEDSEKSKEESVESEESGLSENPTFVEIGKDSSRNNLAWIIINEENDESFGWGENTSTLRARLFGYIYHLGKDHSGYARILKSTDHYVIQKIADSFAGMKYVECWGQLENGYYFLIRTPMESIEESALISEKFHLIVGAFMGVLSILLVLFFAKRVTRPISELTTLSQKMADLNFDAKYESHVGNEIDVLGESFNKMSKQLERTISELKTANLKLQRDIEDKIKIDEMRKEFLDNVSHELKTPIALIQGYAEGLKENISDDPESREFYCDVIMDESAKMNKLVRNLLTLNQLESGKDAVVMERFDLVMLIHGVLQSMDILIQQKEAHILFDEKEPVYVWADEFKVEEVVTNYVNNALNHLEGARQVEIRIHPEDGKVRVTVFNTGIPIPEKDVPNLWNKFYKVDKARTREYGGSGIGLSIVKAIMNSMNQEYGVKNYENGVEFYFTLDQK